LVISIDKREFLESLEEGEEIIPDWEKWTLPLSNNTHQFCKLLWAGCKHFLPEKASMSELDLPRDMRINWQWLALPWPGFHTWSTTSFSSHSPPMTGDKNHCRRHDVCYTRSDAHCPFACAALQTPPQRCNRSEFALAFLFG
jgi:hypothetical protein